MADLDDFFAKKDRKKGTKGAKKFTTTEELAKKLDETLRREKERVKENKKLSSQNVDADGELGGERQEEDEWKDFEEEKKDYTNLKIQNLQITETPNTEGENEVGEDGEQIMEENEAGEMVPRKKQPAGPWMNVQSQQQQQQQQQHQQQQRQQPEEPVREEARPQPPASAVGGGDGGGGSGGGGYIPPHLRGGNASAHSYAPPSAYSSPSSYSSSMHSQPLSSSRFRSKAAPDITNEAFFPTLSAANNAEPGVGAWGRRRDDGRGFEEVRNARTGNSTYNPRMASSGGGPNLHLGNRWDTLRDS